ncbi:MAG: chemotaxis protein CheC [Candidatus Omnitrophica bacterium]|nr:chemotaxis protein CheC [Candidatus Omnitrophota bacterium]
MEQSANKLNPEQIDILKEVGNICVGNSTGILSQLLGGCVNVEIPSLEEVSKDDIAQHFKERGKMVYGVNAQISTHLQGTIFLLFSENDSLEIIEKFIKEMQHIDVHSIQLGISIMKEIGGIAIFSYVNTLSSLLRKLITTTIPNFLSGSTDELLTMILREYEHWGQICIVHTVFREKSLEVEGTFYLILDKSSTDIILNLMQNPSGE